MGYETTKSRVQPYISTHLGPLDKQWLDFWCPPLSVYEKGERPKIWWDHVAPVPYDSLHSTIARRTPIIVSSPNQAVPVAAIAAFFIIMFPFPLMSLAS